MDIDVSGMTPQQRADKIGCMIKAEVDAGRFKLSDAFIWRVNKNQCAGCAIGSLAFALGCREDREVHGAGGPDRLACHEHIARTAPGLISAEERLQLEMGYEAWHQCAVNGYSQQADKDSPFFQLGKKMSLASGHAPPVAYEARGL